MTQPFPLHAAQPEDDEPFDRCPLCGAAMGAIVTLLIIASLWGGSLLLKAAL